MRSNTGGGLSPSRGPGSVLRRRFTVAAPNQARLGLFSDSRMHREPRNPYSRSCWRQPNAPNAGYAATMTGSGLQPPNKN
jgi:hypothetical protein